MFPKDRNDLRPISGQAFDTEISAEIVMCIVDKRSKAGLVPYVKMDAIVHPDQLFDL